MQNTDLKRQIEYAMRRVPPLGRGWRYIPLHQLPVGTEILLDVNDAEPDAEPRSINNKDEIDVLRLPAGCYSILIGIWPTISFSPFKDDTLAVKPYNRFLAPSSVFEGNADLPKETRKHRDDTYSITYRLTTGKINSLFIPDTKFKLTTDDEKQNRVRRPKRHRNRHRSSYIPLRKRM